LARSTGREGGQESEFRSQESVEGKKEKKEEAEVRTPAARFEDLTVWQKARQFVLTIYRLSCGYPRSETYGLSSQFWRATVSIAANIAEGFRKRGVADKLRFYNIAQGSLEECRYYLILSRDLGYRDVTEPTILIEETSKLLEAYSQAIRNANR
jgi:four helix bundle protein